MTHTQVTLTPVSTEDAVDMFSALSHPGVGDFIGGPVADSPESMQHVIERWVAGLHGGARGSGLRLLRRYCAW